MGKTEVEDLDFVHPYVFRLETWYQIIRSKEILLWVLKKDYLLKSYGFRCQIKKKNDLKMHELQNPTKMK